MELGGAGPSDEEAVGPELGLPGGEEEGEEEGEEGEEGEEEATSGSSTSSSWSAWEKRRSRRATASSCCSASRPRLRSSWNRLSTRRTKYPNMMDAAYTCMPLARLLQAASIWLPSGPMSYRALACKLSCPDSQDAVYAKAFSCAVFIGAALCKTLGKCPLLSRIDGSLEK